jgi:hypothetical protein
VCVYIYIYILHRICWQIINSYSPSGELVEDVFEDILNKIQLCIFILSVKHRTSLRKNINMIYAWTIMRVQLPYVYIYVYYSVNVGIYVINRVQEANLLRKF